MSHFIPPRPPPPPLPLHTLITAYHWNAARRCAAPPHTQHTHTAELPHSYQRTHTHKHTHYLIHTKILRVAIQYKFTNRYSGNHASTYILSATHTHTHSLIHTHTVTHIFFHWHLQCKQTPLLPHKHTSLSHTHTHTHTQIYKLPFWHVCILTLLLLHLWGPSLTELFYYNHVISVLVNLKASKGEIR